MSTQPIFKTAAEAKTRRQELAVKIESLKTAIASSQQKFASALAAGKTGDNFVDEIQRSETELHASTAALGIVSREGDRLYKLERIEGKKHLSENLMEQFESEILPLIRAAVQKYADWRQQDELRDLGVKPEGDPLTDPTESAFDSHGGIKSQTAAIAAIVKQLLRKKTVEPEQRRQYTDAPQPVPHGDAKGQQPAPRNERGEQLFVRPVEV